MTTKAILTIVFLSALTPAQSAPKRTQAPSKPSSAVSTPASQNGKGQKDAAAKGSGSHSGNMSGNHKDIMGAAANTNGSSGSHTGNMIGNHKDVMETTAPAPAPSGKTQPTASPAAQPAPNQPKK